MVDIDYLKRAYLTIGGDGVSVNRVVVVQTAVGVHVALVVRVRRVGRAEPPVAGGQLMNITLVMMRPFYRPITLSV
mgnify:CR=1 FL=1